MDRRFIGALDIGGTKIAASVAGPQGPLARVTQPTVKTGPVRALGDQAIALLRQASANAGIDFNLLKTVGVSSAGPFVDIDGMRGVSTPNICGGRSRHPELPNDWEVIPLELVLRECFDTVVIENDCVTALVGERTFGAVQDQPNCVYATWSTGIGFGLCVDGHVLRGKHGNAGHAGHMLMDPVSGARCGCGNLGDLEALISGRNIAYLAGRPAPELLAAARAGEPAARAIAMEAARWFGLALYNLTATLDTGIFVIGGSVWTNHGDWLAPAVMQELATRLPALTQGVKLVPAALEGLVADVGAFSLVMPQDWIPVWRERQPWHALEPSSTRHDPPRTGIT